MKKDSTVYDYIICGGGCAGLSLGMRLADPFFTDKKVLIIDKEAKTQNDKTWCFWEESDSPDVYADIVSNKWDKIIVSDRTRRIKKSLDPLRYKRIQSIHFYEKAKSLFEEAPHIEIVNEEIRNIAENEDRVEIQTHGSTYTGKLCFNSIPRSDTDSKEYLLQQHFLGWTVRFESPILKDDVVELMDFRIPQKDQEVRFLYVLPFNEKEAMLEVTIFSEEVFDNRAEYESMLKEYIDTYFNNAKYEVLEEEFGVIPMSTESYRKKKNSKIIPIGNRSGRIKPSSGYAFKRIQEETSDIVEKLKSNTKPVPNQNTNRFLFYDKILFNVLLNKRLLGADVFTTMFEKNDAAFVLKFLGEKTNIFEEAWIFMRLPFIPFFKALISETFRRFSYK